MIEDALSTRHLENDHVNRDNQEDWLMTDEDNENHQKVKAPDRNTWSGSIQSTMERERRLASEHGRVNPGTWTN